MNKRLARQIARYRAGLIVDSALSAGWYPEDLVDRYGDDGVQQIADELAVIANRLAPPDIPDPAGG